MKLILAFLLSLPLAGHSTLLGRWLMDNNFTDSGGAGNNLVSNGTPQWTTGDKCEGTHSFLSHAAATYGSAGAGLLASLQNNTAFTVDVYIYQTARGGNAKIFTFFDGAVTSKLQLGDNASSPETIQWAHQGATLTEAASIAWGQCYRIRCVLDGTAMSLYIDGVLVDSGSGGTALGATTLFAVGSDTGTGCPATNIDDFSLWDTAIAPDTPTPTNTPVAGTATNTPSASPTTTPTPTWTPTVSPSATHTVTPIPNTERNIYLDQKLFFFLGRPFSWVAPLLFWASDAKAHSQNQNAELTRIKNRVIANCSTCGQFTPHRIASYGDSILAASDGVSAGTVDGPRAPLLSVLCQNGVIYKFVGTQTTAETNKISCSVTDARGGRTLAQVYADLDSLPTIMPTPTANDWIILEGGSNDIADSGANEATLLLRIKANITKTAATHSAARIVLANCIPRTGISIAPCTAAYTSAYTWALDNGFTTSTIKLAAVSGTVSLGTSAYAGDAIHLTEAIGCYQYVIPIADSILEP